MYDSVGDKTFEIRKFATNRKQNGAVGNFNDSNGLTQYRLRVVGI